MKALLSLCDYIAALRSIDDLREIDQEVELDPEVGAPPAHPGVE